MYCRYFFGPVVQLVRMSGWQSEDQGFDSPRVHQVPYGTWLRSKLHHQALIRDLNTNNIYLN